MFECEQYFFDVPVYRISETQYYNEMNRYIQKQRDAVPSHYPLMSQIEERTRAQFGGSWRYNEIVGYIRLHFVGTQIRGEWYRVVAKRLVRTRNKILEQRSHKLAAEVEIPARATNIEIFELIRKYLEDCRSELPNRFIDDEVLKRIGPYVDWRQILENS